MENLQYVIEDRTIAELLGIQNFTNDESAVLELVKNAYDAGASMVNLDFFDTQLVIKDNGCGMNYDNIKKQWMHVGKSLKQYSASDLNNKMRVLAGSKGIGRFALARLGESACIYTKTTDGRGVRWETDWASSTLSFDDEITDVGTVIVIYNLRAKWNSKKIKQLKEFLSKTYNDDAMTIVVTDEESSYTIEPYFPERINWRYSGETEILILQNNPGKNDPLNFRNYVAIDINKGIREGYIDSFQIFMESLIRSSRSKVDTKDIASALRKSRISIKDIVKDTITECKKIPLPIKKILTDRLFYKCANNYNVAP